MRRMRNPAVLFALFLAGCASTNLPPVTSAEYRLQPDEKRIWMMSAEEEQHLADSDMIYRNEKLTAYLNDVAMKVLPAEARDKVDIEVIVINNPYCNAFAFPNGKVYVHTGFLARMDNEAQLATLLGHEMAHVIHRHQVRERRSIRNKAAGMASFRATFGSLPLVGELSSALGELGTMAAVSGYSRDLESEADDAGLRWMIAAGYDPREAPRLFEHLMAENEEEEVEEPFFFGSHPRLKDRFENYNRMLSALSPGGEGVVNRQTFEKTVALAVYETAVLDLKAGRFDRAQKNIERYLATYPKSSRAHFLMGEICRQRNADGDYKKAVSYLSEATRLDHRQVDSYRSLGLVHMNNNNMNEARRAFRTYLKKAPNAEDRGFIDEYIRQMK